MIDASVAGRGQRLKSRLTWRSPPSQTPRVVPRGWHDFYPSGGPPRGIDAAIVSRSRRYFGARCRRHFSINQAVRHLFGVVSLRGGCMLFDKCQDPPPCIRRLLGILRRVSVEKAVGRPGIDMEFVRDFCRC